MELHIGSVSASCFKDPRMADAEMQSPGFPARLRRWGRGETRAGSHLDTLRSCAGSQSWSMIAAVTD